MLTSLLIKDFALIEQLELEFRNGLTILTGETGAGKSILIDALGLIFGERADTSMIRHGASKSIVEAQFNMDDNSRVQKLFADLEVDQNEHIIIRREITTKGQTRSFINDTPVSVSDLKKLGDALADLHGQHEHQSLLHPHTHIHMLDSFGELDAPVAAYANKFRAFETIRSQLKEFYQKKNTAGERQAVLEYQLREINAINPREGEDVEIERELTVGEHSERLSSTSHEIIELLYDGENSVIEKLGRVGRYITELSRIDASLASLVKEHASAHSIVEEVVRSIKQYIDKIEFDPEKIEAHRARLGGLISLKRKYGGSLTSVLEKRDALQAEFDSIDSVEEKIATLEKELSSLRSECSKLARQLTQKRKTASEKFGRQIEAGLKELGIAYSSFTTVLSQQRYTADDDRYMTSDGEKVVPTSRGWDEVEFYLTTNVGEEVKPLARVVSGGEVSRIMLAIKSILAGHDAIPLLIFDEIDVGVSGKIAQKVGAAMKKLSRYHQVIAITHLPQIAAFGDQHYVVEKIVRSGRTATNVRVLDNHDREMEIARLLSGHEVTKSSLQSAKELMNAPM